MNSKEKRKARIKAALERVRDNPVLAHMRRVAYSPTSTQCIEEGQANINKSLSSQEAIKKAEEKRLRKQERNKKNG